MSAWPFLSALVLACCALALIGWWKNDYQLALPAMMFFLGVIIRDVQNLHRYTVAWPLTARMLDWQKIDELIAESRAMDATGLAEEIPETRVDS